MKTKQEKRVRKLNCLVAGNPALRERYRRYYRKWREQYNKDLELLPPEERTEKLPPQIDE